MEELILMRTIATRLARQIRQLYPTRPMYIESSGERVKTCLVCLVLQGKPNNSFLEVNKYG